MRRPSHAPADTATTSSWSCFEHLAEPFPALRSRYGIRGARRRKVREMARTIRFTIAAAVLVVAWAGPARAGSIGGCPVFPANNVWNHAVDAWAVHAQSSSYIASIGTAATLRIFSGTTP